MGITEKHGNYYNGFFRVWGVGLRVWGFKGLGFGGLRVKARVWGFRGLGSRVTRIWVYSRNTFSLF